MSNDAPMTPQQAANVLFAMIGQLTSVMDHYRDQPNNVSTDTRNKTLATMGEQLEAMKHGRAAIAYCVQDGAVEAKYLPENEAEIMGTVQ